MKIGKQTWLAENKEEGSDEGEGYFECYGNKYANCKKYGGLYNWEWAMNICPKGWHLPSKAEWEELIDYAGKNVAGKHLKAATGWNNNGNGQDTYGFSALPGGFKNFKESKFANAGFCGYWWTSSETNNVNAYCWKMDDEYDYVKWQICDKDNLVSVRCVMD
jgi:uncharacterized protein (TIGR02145 family)